MTRPSTKVPRVRFGIKRLVSEFCHLSVLYSDCLPSELADGMLGNKNYQQQNAALRQNEVFHSLEKARQISPESWYSFARALMRTNSLEDACAMWTTTAGMGDELIETLRKGATGYDEIWATTQGRLEEYRQRFEAVWSPISEEVLANLSELAKREWVQKDVQVHFVDCLWGGFAWTDCIAFTPFPDIEVQKKFLAHELSELITPHSIVERELASSGLSREITHTVVDMIAYFSVREFIAKPTLPSPERRGIRPNPNYYPAAEELYPLFEHYAENRSSYEGFDVLVREMVARLKSRLEGKIPQGA